MVSRGAEALTSTAVLQDSQEKETVIPERAEEAKLKAKYPNLGQKPGGSDFLMKRLQKGVLICALHTLGRGCHVSTHSITEPCGGLPCAPCPGSEHCPILLTPPFTY